MKKREFKNPWLEIKCRNLIAAYDECFNHKQEEVHLDKKMSISQVHERHNENTGSVFTLS